MNIKATVWNSPYSHEVVVSTAGAMQSLQLPARATGAGVGSPVNGGEFLMLALATCYCNSLYREAAKLGLQLDGVEVEASANFAGVGLAASDIRYRAWVASHEPTTAIAELLRVTDTVSEVHSTLRAGVPVTLVVADS